jgi:hypothetical protein
VVVEPDNWVSNAINPGAIESVSESSAVDVVVAALEFEAVCEDAESPLVVALWLVPSWRNS